MFGASAAALVIGTRRSADPVLKMSLKWLGLALIFYVLSFVINPIVGLTIPTLTQFEFFYSYYALPSGVVGIVSAYCLYRSARSLAPIGRISLER
jgi:hypothetical protein